VIGGALLLGIGQGAWRWYHNPPTPKRVQPRPAPSTQTADIKPWGRLVATPLRLEKPAEMLPDLTGPMRRTRWHFAGRTREQTIAFLDSCGLTTEQRASLIAPDALTGGSNGCWIVPPPEAVLSLSRDSREKLYAELARSAENITYQHPFGIRLAVADTWFAGSGLPADKLQLAQRLTYRRGHALCFADTEIAQRFLTRDEFHALVRVLYSSDTLLLRLRIEPGDSIEPIAAYWTRGWQKSSTKALLQSLAHGGGEIDVTDLLPPLPRTWLYTFPNAAAGAEAVADCFSTSLNFFQPSHERSLLQPAVRNDTFRRRYVQVPHAERFGDIIVFGDALGAALHACVYVAEDFVFTKNGAQNTHPWVFMRLESVRLLYEDTEGLQTYVFRLRES